MPLFGFSRLPAKGPRPSSSGQKQTAPDCGTTIPPTKLPALFDQADILNLIFDILPSGCLPGLARVSRNVHDAVLPYIWKKLTQRTIVCLTRELDLTAQPAGRFLLRASLVKDLTLDFHSDRLTGRTRISELDELITCAAHTAPVLPNLRAFRIYPSAAVDLTYAHYFLGPSLYSLEIGCGGINMQTWTNDEGYSEQVICELLIVIKERCNNLHTISFVGMPWLRDIEEVGTVIEHLIGVTTYCGDGVALSPRVLTGLSEPRHIHCFKMHIQPSQYDIVGDSSNGLPLDGLYTDPFPLLQSIKECIKRDSFASLRHIDLNCDLVVAITLLKRLQSPVQDITLFCSSRRNIIRAEQLDTLLRNISKFGIWLRNLELTFVEPFDPLLRRHEAVSWETFAPLLQCSEIERFSLTYDTADPFDFTDHHLPDIACSWPHLEFFKLDWDTPVRHALKGISQTGLQDPASLTLAGLLHFASQYPRLRSLTVAWLDATGKLMNSPAPHPTIPWPLVLGVGYGHMENAADVAGFLRKVRPNVRVEWRSSLGLESPRTDWGKVQQLLAVSPG